MKLLEYSYLHIIFLTKLNNVHLVFTTHRKWQRLETLMAITDAVHDVAFAPNLGR